jgi:hypothetical protein
MGTSSQCWDAAGVHPDLQKTNKELNMSTTVDGAVSTIKSNLDQGALDWDVTHGELLENTRMLAQLSREQRNEVISRLTDDELKNWTEEIDGELGALTASERQELFRMLAESLDGEQLARLIKAFNGEPSTLGDLKSAITQHASADTKLSLIEALKGQIDGGYQSDGKRYGNTEAGVVAAVLGSLSNDPAAFDAAVKSLSQEQLNAVMAAGLDLYVADYGRSNLGVAGLSDATAILDAAATSSDPEVKARVFAAASEQLPLLEGTRARGAFTDAMTKLLESDPNGLIEELRTRVDTGGRSLVAYAQEMLESDKTQKLRGILEQLQRGNDLKGDPLQSFKDPDTARRLGFFVGSIGAAIDNIVGDRGTDTAALQNMLAILFGIVGGAHPVAGAGSVVLGGLSTAGIADIVSQMNDGDYKIEEALYELAVPRNAENQIPTDDKSTPEDEAYVLTVFESAVSGMVRRHRG